MSFRNLDINGDWTFGAGINSYATGINEIALNIKTRILSFLGDCFFATDEGVPWFYLLDYNKQDKAENLIQNVLINTSGVVSVNSVDVSLGANRKLIINYNIDTIYTTSYQNQLEIFGTI